MSRAPLSSIGPKASLNMRAAVVHLATDAVGSLAALVAGADLGVWLVWADSVASVLIALLVLWAGGRLLAQSTHILMEGTPWSGRGRRPVSPSRRSRSGGRPPPPPVEPGLRRGRLLGAHRRGGTSDPG